jgi:hypothetical protein
LENNCLALLKISTALWAFNTYKHKLSVVALWKAWLLNGSAPDCCPVVSGSNSASPLPTADCQSPGGLPPGIALGCKLTSVRGDRGENYEKCQKHKKEKK